MPYVDGVWVDEVATGEETVETTPEEQTGVMGIADPYAGLQSNEEAPDYGTYDPAAVNETIASNVNIQQGSEYVTPESTVAGQLSSLLNTDSKYIEQARLGAAEQAQGRGMLNTSAAAGAGEQAAIVEGSKIASQDASTYAAANQQQQQAEYMIETDKSKSILSAAIVEQEAEAQFTNQQIQNNFSAAMAGANAEEKEWLTNLQAMHSETMAGIQFANDQILANEQYTALEQESIRASNESIMQNYQITIETLLTNPDLILLGGEAMNKFLEDARILAINGIKFNAAIAGDPDMSAWAETYFTSWIGGPTSTVPPGTPAT